MKNKEIVNKINALKNIHIEMIDTSRYRNHTCGLASNYSELINRIADLLKTCKKALDGLHLAQENYITDAEYNIADVLGIIIKLLPFSEMKFIDESVELLEKVNQKKES